MTISNITLGGGCFWCTEAVFQRVRGVLHVESGYCNGLFDKRPSYEQVCRGDTGFNEVVSIEYDTEVVTLRQLLEIFFGMHDPTSLNRQGNDTGTQYRSGIYYTDKADQVVATQFISEVTVRGDYDRSIVTEVLLLTRYWPAEDYHQNYFVNNPDQGYCTFVVAPKVRKSAQHFAEWLKP
jgi:peptide-methionine (S)-S-oxide reductase